MKPVIGLTMFNEKNDDRVYSSLSNNYINSIRLAGGVPLLIPINEEDINQYIDMVDGVLFTGGGDLAPELYGESPIPELGDVSEERDSFELKLFNKVYEAGKPILGICRGCQLINVALGGTLYQDINAQLDNVEMHSPDKLRDEVQHSVNIDKNSLLYKLLGKEELETNSFHHQAVKALGTNLRVTAKSKDDIIEAYESTNGSKLICVQWHPEDLVLKYPYFLELFKYLCSGE